MSRFRMALTPTGKSCGQKRLIYDNIDRGKLQALFRILCEHFYSNQSAKLCTIGQQQLQAQHRCRPFLAGYAV